MNHIGFLTGSKVCHSNDAICPITYWTNREKKVFQLLFLFFCFQILPIDSDYLKMLSRIKIFSIEYEDIFNLTHYYPQFLYHSPNLLNLLVFTLIIVLVSWIWSFFDSRSEYNKLYYWLRVVIRYRLAAALTAYGFIKLIPLQFPEPSLSNLNTNYGDFTSWKLFSLSLGVVPGYLSMLGTVEIFAALLLFYRKTTPLACIIIILFTGNVFISNLAYGGNETGYALYLLVLSFFLFSYDAPRIFRVLTSSTSVQPNLFKINLSSKWQKYARLLLKSAFIFFFVFFYGIRIVEKNLGYQHPSTHGISNLAGFYDVKEFRINSQKYPYSLSDTLRWNNVVFEKWATISIGSNKNIIVDSTHSEFIQKQDTYRNYEVVGSGGRHYYHYEADTLRHKILITNCNKHYQNDTMLLHYQIVTPKSLNIFYLNKSGDSIFVELAKIDKKYLLYESQKVDRSQGIKL